MPFSTLKKVKCGSATIRTEPKSYASWEAGLFHGFRPNQALSRSCLTRLRMRLTSP
jgi:hypothetical protein